MTVPSERPTSPPSTAPVDPRRVRPPKREPMTDERSAEIAKGQTEASWATGRASHASCQVCDGAGVVDGSVCAARPPGDSDLRDRVWEALHEHLGDANNAAVTKTLAEVANWIEESFSSGQAHHLAAVIREEADCVI